MNRPYTFNRLSISSLCHQSHCNAETDSPSTSILCSLNKKASGSETRTELKICIVSRRVALEWKEFFFLAFKVQGLFVGCVGASRAAVDSVYGSGSKPLVTANFSMDLTTVVLDVLLLIIQI